MFPKPKTYRSEKYLAFVRTQPCCVCKNPYGSQPHHTEKSGTSMKGTDLSCIPLCERHHIEIHQTGEETFEQQYNTDIIIKNVETLRNYLMAD